MKNAVINHEGKIVIMIGKSKKFIAFKFTIPKEIEIIGEDDFYSCHMLHSLKIGRNVRSIEVNPKD